jgi:ABC-type thiamine transport system ATPase subunit
VLLGLESIVTEKDEISGNSTTSGNNCNAGSVFLYGQDLTRFNRVPFFSLVGQESDLFRGLNLMENVQYGAHTLLLMDPTTAEVI